MSSIFHGGNTYIFYNTDAGNNIPNSVNYKNIDNLGQFPQVKINSSTTSFETYDDEWVQALNGNMSIDSVSIVVAYVPDNESHRYLDSCFTNQTKFQIKIALYESQDSLEQHYIILSGYISASSDSSDVDAIFNRTYTFTAEDVVARGTTEDPTLLRLGDFGIGSDGEIPQYESSTPSGNSFIKVPATRSDNPLGVDCGGFAYVDNGGDQGAQFIISETGTINLYAKNTNNSWTQVQTKPQNDATYVPLTRKVNGKALSADVALTSIDTGSFAVANNLSEGNAGTIRTNISVYSKSEVDTTLVPKTTTVNGHALSTAIVLSKDDVGLASVSDAAQLKIASNLEDLGDIATARTNLDVYSKEEVDTVSSTLVLKSTKINGKALSADVTLTSTDTGSFSVANNLSEGNAGTIRTNIVAAKSGANSDITSLTGLTTALSIAQGGTGASTVTAALANLGGLPLSGGTLTGALAGTTATFNGAVQGTSIVSTGEVQGTSVVSTGAVTANSLSLSNAVSIGNGGTGATTIDQARTNLGLGSGSSPSFLGLELYNSTPYVDFHYGNTTADFNVRLINDASGYLNLANGRFEAGQGYCTKGGINAARGGSVFNINWQSSVGVTLWIDSTNMGTINFTATSDKELKKDIEYVSDNDSALSEVLQWKPATFKYKARGIIVESDSKLGFIANDLKTASPECVTGEGLPDDYDIEADPNNPDAYQLDQVAMIAKLTLALQEQQVLIKALQENINADSSSDK